MKYMIRTENNTFLTISENGKYRFVTDPQNATLFTEKKASNFLRSSIAPHIRSKCTVVPEVCMGYAVEESEELAFDWSEITESQRELFSKLFQYRELLQSQHSRVDREISDIQHYIEFVNLDAAGGYKAYKLLHDKLVQRRQIKNEHAKASLMLSSTPTSFSSGAVGKKILNVDHQEYTPRVLNELFGSTVSEAEKHTNKAS